MNYEGKVGIVSLEKAQNVGAVLQAYALQEILGNMPADVSFLSLPKKEVPQPKVSSALPAPIRSWQEKLISARKAREYCFQDFRDKYLVDEKEITSYDDFNSIIVGSDQVWNLTLPEASYDFFLPRVPEEKRVAYAASFGGYVPASASAEFIASALSGFKDISVRDTVSKNLVKDLTGKTVPILSDPTILLGPSSWRRLVKPILNPSFGFVYIVDNDYRVYTEAQRIAANEKCDLEVATAGVIPKLGLDAYHNATPIYWLSCVSQCNFIVTNSYHGLLFSLIFDKPIKFMLPESQTSSRNSRFDDIFDCLEDDLLAYRDPILPAINALFEARREASYCYLGKAVSDDFRA